MKYTCNACGMYVEAGSGHQCYTTSVVPPTPRIDHPRDWNASEAIYAFAAYLTALPVTLVVGGAHPVPPIVDHVGTFLRTRQLPEPRAGWEKATLEVTDEPAPR